ncbi:glycosyltransferase family 2 protein [Alphaproteobacteria bacterium LSUCC0684]
MQVPGTITGKTSIHPWKTAAIILTRDEELHIERAIRSVEGRVDVIYVIDSLSVDRTVAIAQASGAKVLEHEWISYADQMNWAIAQLPDDIEWVLRLDADEYLSGEVDFKAERARLLDENSDIQGILCRRSMVFTGTLLRFGGMYKKPVLRLFRKNNAICDARLVDEHIHVDGPVAKANIHIIDDNLKGISFWIEKHNRYAELEARQYLKEQACVPAQATAPARGHAPSLQKRKRGLYYRLPPAFRPFAYFFYRYVLLGGFLDGYAGFRYGFLQAFWYRFLVEIRIREYRSERQDK